MQVRHLNRAIAQLRLMFTPLFSTLKTPQFKAMQER